MEAKLGRFALRLALGALLVACESAPTLQRDADDIVVDPTADAGPGASDADTGTAGPMPADGQDPSDPAFEGPDASAPDPMVSRYLCTEDSDCAAGLVCQDESCTFVPPERLPSTVVQTAGGGLTTGSGLRLELRIGAPSPAGRMQGGGYQLTLGPLSGH